MKLPNRLDINQQYYLKEGHPWQDDYWVKRKDATYLKKIKEIIDKKCNNLNSIIDVGAGPTLFIDEFKKFRKRAVLDIKKWNVYNQLSESTQIITADIYNIPLPNNFFDCVVCTQTLEHLDNPKKACNELKRICNSLLIISVSYMCKDGDPSDIQYNINLKKIKSWIGKFDEYTIVENRIIIEIFI